MKSWTLSLVLCAAASGVASAQPQPPQPPPPPPDQPITPPDQPVQPPVQPPVLPPVPPPPPAPASDVRPEGMSVAIGLGYQLPTSLQTPNITSVRLRLASGLTIEPQLVLASSSAKVDTGTTMEDSSSEVGAGALVRYPLVKRGRVDLELCGALNLNQASTNPEMPDSDVTINTFSASYGIAVTSWLTPHWQISLTALNPILTSTKRDAENPVGNTVTTNTTYGLIFDPSVALMIHLYH